MIRSVRVVLLEMVLSRGASGPSLRRMAAHHHAGAGVCWISMWIDSRNTNTNPLGWLFLTCTEDQNRTGVPLIFSSVFQQPEFLWDGMSDYFLDSNS